MSDKAEDDPNARISDPGLVSDLSLANLMGLDADDAQWSPEGLAAIFRHQMRAPLHYDLVEAEVISGTKLDLACAGAAGPLVTFGDLFSHPAPPGEVVAAVKQFAKIMALTAASAIPPQVARVLYFAAIATAQMRCHERISRLPEKELRAGVEWAVSRPWLDEGVRGVLRSAIQKPISVFNLGEVGEAGGDSLIRSGLGKKDGVLALRAP